MNGIQIFNNEQFGQIRIAMNESSEPLFCLADVARSLGYSRPADAVSKHCKGVVVLPTPTQNQHGSIVMQDIKFGKESEVYRLTMKSKLPEAEKFQDWVCEDILPSIRKHGAYMMTNKEDTPEEIMAKAVMYAQAKIAEQANAIDNLEEVNKLQHKQLVISAPKVAYYDAAMESNSTYSTTMIAKDLGMDAAKLNSILKNLGIQYKQAGTWYLYSKYQGNGYTRVIPRYFTHSDGTPGNSPQTRWTEKGREFILNLRKENKL